MCRCGTDFPEPHDPCAAEISSVVGGRPFTQENRCSDQTLLSPQRLTVGNLRLALPNTTLHPGPGKPQQCSARSRTLQQKVGLGGQAVTQKQRDQRMQPHISPHLSQAVPTSTHLSHHHTHTHQDKKSPHQKPKRNVLIYSIWAPSPGSLLEKWIVETLYLRLSDVNHQPLFRTSRMGCLKKAGSKNLVEIPTKPGTLDPLFICTIHGERSHSEAFTKR